MTEANDPSYSAAKPATEASRNFTAPPPSPETAADPDKGADDSIPLPPLTLPAYRETTPEQLATEIARLDWGLAAVVVILAFLLASFAVRNGDFWQHLASGRLYAAGQFNFGVDPFAYPTTGSYL